MVYPYPILTQPAPYIAEEVQKEMFGEYVARFQAGYPEWDGKPLTPEQSVTAILDVASRLTTKDSGACLTHHGDTKNWL